MPAPAMQIPMQIPMKFYTPIHVQRQKGMMLVELLVAVLLSAFLVMGLVQIVSAARSSFRLQESEAEVQENGRHAIATLGVLIRQAGFSPQPWNESFQSPAFPTLIVSTTATPLTMSPGNLLSSSGNMYST